MAITLQIHTQLIISDKPAMYDSVKINIQEATALQQKIFI